MLQVTLLTLDMLKKLHFESSLNHFLLKIHVYMNASSAERLDAAACV